MQSNRRPLVLFSVMAFAACAGSPAGRPPVLPDASTVSTGGSPGAGGTVSGDGGSGGTVSTGGSSSGGSGGETGTGGSAPGPDAGTPGADSGSPPPPAVDGGAVPGDYTGEIPPYEGPPVGPEVKMDCPEDPTQGFTEYKDTFHVEKPSDLPVSARFSIDGGIYTFWVMHGDKQANPGSQAHNPRTEARYKQNFRTGTRLFSADVLWEKSVANGTVVMQVHTTTTGIGPVYMVANANGVSPLGDGKLPGGIYDKWVNLKVEITAGSTASRYWINNCLVATQGNGTRGDGNDYFKMGVYHCDTGLCRDHYKNVHLYLKP
jgi:hypothetical protein